MEFKQGDKVIVKGLCFPFIFHNYINDKLAKILLDGESVDKQHSVINVKVEVLLPNNRQSCEQEGWF